MPFRKLLQQLGISASRAKAINFGLLITAAVMVLGFIVVMAALGRGHDTDNARTIAAACNILGVLVLFLRQEFISRYVHEGKHELKQDLHVVAQNATLAAKVAERSAEDVKQTTAAAVQQARAIPCPEDMREIIRENCIQIGRAAAADALAVMAADNARLIAKTEALMAELATLRGDPPK